jgi:hypothetical protein
MKKFIGLSIFTVLLLAGCTKEPGDGGNSSVKGVLEKEIRIVLSNPATYQFTVPAADEDVYIVYGDHLSPDDRIATNYNGEFEFLNLRKGKYTIYVYSKDTTGLSGVDPDRMVIKHEVEITEKNQEITVPLLTIYDVP